MWECSNHICKGLFFLTGMLDLYKHSYLCTFIYTNIHIHVHKGMCGDG